MFYTNIEKFHFSKNRFSLVFWISFLKYITQNFVVFFSFSTGGAGGINRYYEWEPHNTYKRKGGSVGQGGWWSFLVLFDFFSIQLGGIFFYSLPSSGPVVGIVLLAQQKAEWENTSYWLVFCCAFCQTRRVDLSERRISKQVDDTARCGETQRQNLDKGGQPSLGQHSLRIRLM